MSSIGIVEYNMATGHSQVIARVKHVHKHGKRQVAKLNRRVNRLMVRFMTKDTDHAYVTRRL